MKTYCKHLNVADERKIYSSIVNYMYDKCRKGSTIRFYACYSGLSKPYVKELLSPDRSDDQLWKESVQFWTETNRAIAHEMAEHIRNRTVKEHLREHAYRSPLIRYVEITDPGSGKERVLGLETVLFRLYEAVAQDATAPMFNAKRGEYQVASVKGKGQNFGKKAVKRWISSDADGTKYNTKSDIRHCYPSIRHDKLKKLLHRDLEKCPDLLYLYDTFLELYDEYPNPAREHAGQGILIGSPVSKELCNYILSYAYHYVSEKLDKIVRRRGKEKRVRLVNKVIFYMDDIVLYGGNKKDLKKATEKMIAYLKDELGLTVKSDWKLSKTMYQDTDGKSHGVILDYMGFRFHGGGTEDGNYFGCTVRHRKVWVTIRRNIFLRARRKLAALEKKIRKGRQVSLKFARSVVSVYGWFKNTNMVTYRKKNHVDKLVAIARRIISDDAKGRAYNENKYYKMWRRIYA